MNLYITPGSPYARMARVPYLVRDDGVGMEESALICAYLDRLDGRAALDLPADDPSWEARRLEARNPGFRWRPGHPKRSEWFDRIAARPSFSATVPPSA